MTRATTAMILAAAAALAGCNKENHTIVAGPGAEDDVNVAAEANIQLPPSIVASKAYRCKDNSLVYIDWLSDGTARIKQDKAEIGTTVTPGAEGAPLTGDSKAASVTYNGQSCKG